MSRKCLCSPEEVSRHCLEVLRKCVYGGEGVSLRGRGEADAEDDGQQREVDGEREGLAEQQRREGAGEERLECLDDLQGQRRAGAVSRRPARAGGGGGRGEREREERGPADVCEGNSPVRGCDGGKEVARREAGGDRDELPHVIRVERRRRPQPQPLLASERQRRPEQEHRECSDGELCGGRGAREVPRREDLLVGDRVDDREEVPAREGERDLELAQQLWRAGPALQPPHRSAALVDRPRRIEPVEAPPLLQRRAWRGSIGRSSAEQRCDDGESGVSQPHVAGNDSKKNICASACSVAPSSHHSLGLSVFFLSLRTTTSAAFQKDLADPFPNPKFKFGFLFLSFFCRRGRGSVFDPLVRNNNMSDRRAASRWRGALPLTHARSATSARTFSSSVSRAATVPLSSATWSSASPSSPLATPRSRSCSTPPLARTSAAWSAT